MKSIIIFILVGIFIVASGFQALGEDKFTVSGEIAYWHKGQPKGQILVRLINQEEFKKMYEIGQQIRTLKIELSSQEVQENKLQSETVPFRFVDVLKGTHGSYCILDLNKNGKLDYPEGATPGKVPPIEPYALSGPKRGFSRPVLGGLRI
jgi:hypothetical protein